MEDYIASVSPEWFWLWGPTISAVSTSFTVSCCLNIIRACLCPLGPDIQMWPWSAFAFLSIQVSKPRAVLPPVVLLQRTISSVFHSCVMTAISIFQELWLRKWRSHLHTATPKSLENTHYEIIIITEGEMSFSWSRVSMSFRLLLPLPVVFPLLCILQELRQLWQSWAGFSSLSGIIACHNSDHHFFLHIVKL